MRKFNMKSEIFILLLSCTILIGWIDPASDKNEEGVQLYNEKKYDEAIGKFTDAQLYLRESNSLNFNIANAQYKKGKFPEAEKLFKDVMGAKDITLKAKSNYNMGNSMYRQGKFKESLGFYKQTIELTEEQSGIGNDELKGLREDAKYNYEFVQKKIEEMKKEQEQQEQKDQEKQEEKQQDKQRDEQDREEQNEQEEKSPQEKKAEEQPSQPYEKKEITKEDAERILDALKQAESAARYNQENERKSAKFNIEKD